MLQNDRFFFVAVAVNFVVGCVVNLIAPTIGLWRANIRRDMWLSNVYVFSFYLMRMWDIAFVFRLCWIRFKWAPLIKYSLVVIKNCEQKQQFQKWSASFIIERCPVFFCTLYKKKTVARVISESINLINRCFVTIHYSPFHIFVKLLFARLSSFVIWFFSSL